MFQYKNSLTTIYDLIINSTLTILSTSEPQRNNARQQKKKNYSLSIKYIKNNTK